MTMATFHGTMDSWSSPHPKVSLRSPIAALQSVWAILIGRYLSISLPAAVRIVISCTVGHRAEVEVEHGDAHDDDGHDQQGDARAPETGDLPSTGLAGER